MLQNRHDETEMQKSTKLSFLNANVEHKRNFSVHINNKVKGVLSIYVDECECVYPFLLYLKLITFPDIETLLSVKLCTNYKLFI